MKYILLIGSLCSFSFTAIAQNTDLDSTFGTNGFVTTTVGSGTSGALFDVAIQPDSRIVASGVVSGAATVVRYRSSGVLDNSLR